MREPPRRQPTDLDAALSDLGAQLAFPPTPDLVRVVRTRLVSQPAPRAAWWELWPLQWAVVAACVTLAVAMGTVVALSPETRAAVADRLGLPGIAITHVDSPPDPTLAAPTPNQPQAPPGGNLGLGERLSLDEAQGRVAFTLLLPRDTELGAPDAVYLGSPPAGGQVSLVFGAREDLPTAALSGVGLLLTQFRGQVEPGLFGKGLGPGAVLEAVTVNGSRGYWIAGQPHSFGYRNQTGSMEFERMRLAGNTLLWEQGVLTLRLESGLSKDEALRLAATVR